MQPKFVRILGAALLTALLLVACSPATQAPQPASALKVLATETFLADIAQNVAGERVRVESLLPIGVDPHTFAPTPKDVQRIAESNVLILNGGGFEQWAEKTLENAGGERLVIEASAGLTMRHPQQGPAAHEHEDEAHSHSEDHTHSHEGDPHFWFDPTLVVRYVENIRDGLIAADPEGKEVYTANAAAYIAKLNELDAWIKAQVDQIPPERRLLVTDHETFGYFADRYGFQLVGALIPSVTTEASPSAQAMAALVEQIRATGAPAVFLEAGRSTQLAEQIAAETGVKVVTDIYTHSLTEPNGKAPTYLDMMRHNVTRIVEALK